MPTFRKTKSAPWRLRPILILFSLFLALFPVILLGVIGIHGISQILTQEIETKSEMILEALSQGMEGFTDHSELFLRQSLTVVDNFLPEHPQRVGQQLDEMRKTLPWVESLEILDRRGVEVFRSPSSMETLGFDYRNQIYFQALEKGASLVWTPSFNSPRTSEATVVLAARGRFYDAVATLNLARVQEVALEISEHLEPGLHFSILDARGVYLADPLFDRVRYRETSPWFRDLSGSEAVRQKILITAGKAYLTVSTRLSRPGWTIVISQEQEKAFEAVTTATLVLGGVALVWVVLALGFSSWIIASLNRPLASLAGHVEKISQGRYFPLEPLHTWQELEELIFGFNAMVSAIGTRDRELREKNAELERFTYTVSHDLKSPLVTVKGFSGLVLQDLDKNDLARARADMGKIGSAADKMTQLLEDLLELSRIGRLVNPPKAFSMNQALEEALSLLEGPLTGVAVTRVDHWPLVMGDLVRIREVWQNLIENALKYRHPDRPLTLEFFWRPEGPRPVFIIRDNGQGVPPEYRERIFGLFEKLQPGSEGSGIGLALVKRIVEFHGGRVWAEDGAEGGTSFCFTLGAPA